MLNEIIEPHLKIVLVAPFLTQVSDELGFYYLDTDFHIWFLLEYAGITSPPIFTQKERKLLLDAKKGNVLNEMYRQLFFEKKESALHRSMVGMTVLNRRIIGHTSEDTAALPSPNDVKEFIRTIEKNAPRLVAFVGKPEIFGNCFSSFYPSARRDRGRQEYLIGTSEVWHTGEIKGKKDSAALEEVFDEMGRRVGEQ